MSLQRMTSHFVYLLVFLNLFFMAGCSSKPFVVMPESLLEEQLEDVPLVFPGTPMISHHLDTGTTSEQSWRHWIQWLKEPPLPDAVKAVVLDGDDQARMLRGGSVWVPWLKSKADSGDTTAQVMLGLLRQQGGMIEVNSMDSLRWLDKAAESGDSFAAWHRALAMLQDSGKVDAVRLDKLLNLAVKNHNALAEMVLARLYRDGNRLVQNASKSKQWYQLAVKNSSDKSLQNNARLNIGLMQWFGIGKRKKNIGAVDIWKQAAEAGDARAAYFSVLGRLGKDSQENTALLKQAAAGGVLEAVNQQGLISWQSQNYITAASLFDRGQQAGDRQAAYNMGVAFYTGKGRTPNFHKAMVMFSSPAAQGDRDALRLQGFIHWQGPKPVGINFSKAREAFTKAASLGDLYSHYALGLMAAIGQGEPRDLVTAWSNMAVVAAWGVPEAATVRDIVVTKMTEQEKAIARKRAQTLFDNCKTMTTYLEIERQPTAIKAALVKPQS